MSPNSEELTAVRRTDDRIVKQKHKSKPSEGSLFNDIDNASKDR